MKKSLITASAVVLAFAALAPRTFAAATSFGWGIKMGFSSGKVYQRGPLPVDWIGEEAFSRPTFCVYGAFSLGDRLVVQPEILYLAQGGGGKFIGTDEKILYEFDYIHVPVLAKFRLMQGVAAVPAVFAGPSVGFLLSAKARSYLGDTFQNEERITDLYKKVNLGLLFGLGVDWKLSRLTLVFDARFDLGLTNISLQGAPITKTRTFSFLVGVGF